MNTKERNNKLMGLADEAICQTKVLLKEGSNTDIQISYNGQISALSVSIAMSGLRPALAIYFQDGVKDKSKVRTKVNRCAILEVVADMIRRDGFAYGQITDAKSLFAYSLKNDIDLKELQREVIDCAIALKQVVRTYNLE